MMILPIPMYRDRRRGPPPPPGAVLFVLVAVLACIWAVLTLTIWVSDNVMHGVGHSYTLWSLIKWQASEAWRLLGLIW